MNANRKTASQEITTTYSLIKQLMEDNVELRNDDRRLLVAFWKIEIENMDSIFGNDSFLHFFELGKLTSSESICRNARMIRNEMNWKIDKSKEQEKAKMIFAQNLFE